MALNILIFLCWFVGIADVTATAILIHYGIIEEWNPFMRWFLEHGGIGALVWFKTLYHTTLIGFIFWIIQKGLISRRKGIWYATVTLGLYIALVGPPYILVWIYAH